MAGLYYTVVTPSVVVSRRGADRIRCRHPWIFRSDIVGSDAQPGDLVQVRNERKRRLGWALWSDRSQIALRMVAHAMHADGGRGFSPGAELEELDERALWQRRLQHAIDYRASLAIDSTAWRVVHGEADRLPGLIVDRYGDCLVIQTLCQGTDRRLSLFVELLVELLQPRGILARNDPKVRRLEGLDERIEVVSGDVPETIEVTEASVRYVVDLRLAQKTGLFLDQRENHSAARRYGRGRALDAFSYAGGFALALSSACESVLALDSSSAAVRTARENVRLNGFENVEVREANVFDELRELETAGERFDTIVLDPPAFAKNKAALERAVAGYREINLRAFKLLAPGGHLITCTCSYHVDETLFVAIVDEAAIDARADVVLEERRKQSRDHPVLLSVPETYYLKCLVLRRLP
jgi:23S rRNA (cytosine1962-C5)-methyltransferase